MLFKKKLLKYSCKNMMLFNVFFIYMLNLSFQNINSDDFNFCTELVRTNHIFTRVIFLP